MDGDIRMYNGDWDWDDVKNEMNLKKHGFDFWHAGRVFADEHHLIRKDRVDQKTGEQRYHAIGLVGGAVVTVTHTYRKESPNAKKEYVHFISAQRSEIDDEIAYYEQLL